MAARDKKAGKGRPLLPQTLCVLALSFTMFIFAPAEMTMVNSTNFWFSVGDFLPVFAGIGAAAFAVLWAAMLLARKLPYAAWLLTLSLVMGATLGVYVQGTYLCMSSEALISGDPVWRNMLGEMAVNTGIWGAIVLGCAMFALIRPKAFLKAASAASALILVMEVSALSVLALRQEENDDLGRYYCSNEDYFTYSANGDVIVIMLDTFDGQLMNRALREDPAQAAVFEDFTHYRNTATAAYLTDTSFTSFMTGEVYHNQEPFFMYCRRTMKDNPFFARMQENGMTLQVYAAPYGVFGQDQMGVISNLCERNSHIGNMTGFVKEMLCMVGYRYAPTVMQPFLLRNYTENFLMMQEMEWGGQGESFTSNLHFVKKQSLDAVTRDDSRRFFKFYTLQGAHGPLNMNRNMQEDTSGQVTSYEQLLGCFAMLDGLFEDMKAQGVYDASTVIVMGDHGETGRYSNPVMMVKYPGEKGPMRTSSAPVSLLDMRATALYGAGLSHEGIGRPAHEWEGEENRERTIVFYDYEVPFGYQFYMNEMTEYFVPQDVEDVDAYVPSGRVFRKES